MSSDGDTLLRNQLVAKDLTGSGYEPIPDEIKNIIPLERMRAQKYEQERMALPGYEIIEEERKLSQQQDPLSIAALKTVDWEARKDKQGNVQVYKLPSGDMGGSFEVAGINDKYHPEAFKRIASMPADQRAQAAAEYIREYTNPLVSKLPEQMKSFAQDMAFNRGMGGATKYIQRGLNALGQNVSVDGALGPKTLQAIGQVQPQALMRAASDAQLQDEYKMLQNNPARKKFIAGLESRIRNRLATFGQG